MYMIYYFVDKGTGDFKGGNHCIVMLLERDKPNESVTSKDTGL